MTASLLPWAGTPLDAQTASEALGDPPLPNPEIADSCGTDVVLALDASGSIGANERNVRNAGRAFLDALADTGSTASVLQFASFSEQLAAQAEVTSTSLDPGGVFAQALADYYSPKPPRPAASTIHRYDGRGDPRSAANWSVSNGSNQYTNWDQSLDRAGRFDPSRPDLKQELIVYITDGDPTAYDLDQAGDPFDPSTPIPVPDVGMNTNRGQAEQTTLDRAVEEANQAKAEGIRILAVGVGAALDNAQSASRLARIAGPQIVRDGDIGAVDGINDIDVALVRDFDQLAQFLRSVVNELCSPSLSIRKLAQSPDDANYLPAPGWDVSVTPSVAGAGSTYRWILPDADPDPVVVARCGSPADPDDQAPRTCATDATGLANFQWEPDPETAPTSALVEEAVQPGYVVGRPGGDDWSCTLKNEDGSEEVRSGELTANGFRLDVDPQQIITCTLFNSFDYGGRQISLEKIDTPVQVRGDLGDPGSTVTSTFTVTNPGTSALSNVTLVDDTCTPVYQSGDLGDDGILDNDPAETWVYTCTRVLTSTPGDDPVTVTNSARVDAVDPAGTAVFDTATADVDVFAPEVTLTKVPNPASIELGVPTDVTYTYVATNTGNMPLVDVDVVDDLGPSTCAPVAPVGAAAPIALDPGASQAFECTVELTAATTDPIENVAEVTGVPTFPAPTPPEGTGPAGPPVTAQAPAVVTVVDTELSLTKAVDQSVVFPGTEVTYTYTIENPGNVDLVRPAGPPGAPDPRDDWIVDTLGPTGTCAPVTYVAGDTDGDEVLDARSAETWTYTCSTTLGATPTDVVNTAVIVAETVGGGTTLTRQATARVEVVRPAIGIEKAAIRPVVLDDYGLASLGDPPGPLAGPDVPLVTPAAYRFSVSNDGNVPIRDVVVTDTFPNSATTSCPPDPVEGGGANVGDADRDGVLDPGEVWEYDCVVRLTKAADADGAPIARDELGVVTNTAQVSGEAFVGTEVFPVGATSDPVQVLVISPELTVTKEPCLEQGGGLVCRDDLVVRPGTDVTYRYEVRNVGDATLRPIGIIDDRCTGIGFVGGDTDGDGRIEGGTAAAEVWEYRCTATIFGPDEVVNTVDVFAVGPLQNLFVAEATAVVRVFDPAIALVKTARESLVPVGTDVGYDFEVTNVGASSLPADDVLARIRLDDVGAPPLPACSTPAFVGGDVDGDGLLDKTETWRYECTATLDADTLNVAVVTGVGGTQLSPPLPVDVADVSAAFVGVFDPGIDVVKTADPTLLVDSGEVTYTYRVRNTGDVPLGDVATRIVDDRCSPVTFVGGDEDGDGLLDTPMSIFEDALEEIWVFSCTTDIDVDTVNTVEVTGTPTDPGGAELCAPAPSDPGSPPTPPCDVTATDTATVTVVRPGSITIVKDAEPDGATPFDFDGDLGAFRLTDDGRGANSATFTGLDPGTYVVSEIVPVGWELRSIVCEDPTADSSADLSRALATIGLGPGENVTCTFGNVRSGGVSSSVPSTDLPATGAVIGAQALLGGLASLLLGSALVRSSRRRRIA